MTTASKQWTTNGAAYFWEGADVRTFRDFGWASFVVGVVGLILWIVTLTTTGDR
ncbi:MULTISPECIES: hypothetical protein [unclassified Streptomyces]|uniref:hypothetical protein n=1 Tax=unclassified Streptomyces TaxID=2593676 RepID=UPI00136A6A66|nr:MULTISPECIES: hypothetical protein [unclassified Streptomyces]MYZ38773.1 hypothetical protein [Streptomyces sp. SID4917]